MNRFAKVFSLFVALGAIVQPAIASSSNPPDLYLGRTGAVSCNLCHNSFSAKGTGALSIQGLPAKFEPGKSYPLTVKLAQAGNKKAGFRLAAQTPTGTQAGVIVNRNPDLDVQVASGVSYLKQSYNGTNTNGTDRAWSFLWKAPASGKVVFSVEGVAADSDGTVRGDHVYGYQASVEAGEPTRGPAD